MAPFPSPVERTVASALLLLSSSSSTTTTTNTGTKPSFLSPPKLGFDGKSVRERSQSKSSCSSRSEKSLNLSSSLVSSSSEKLCSLSLTSNSSSKEIIRAQKLRMFAVVARCHEKIKLKVVRRRRSKVCWSSDDRKVVLGLQATAVTTEEEEEEKEASCLTTSTSSSATSARSRYMTRGGGGGSRKGIKLTTAREKPKRSSTGSISGSGHLKRRADAILKLLSGGCFSEVRIREMLGDSPDTSKALRMLLKKEEIKRFGTGGRHDPYIYTIA